jgi:transcriptional regulator with XRE-family HTH domain
MPFTIATAMPRKQYGETSFGERLQSIRRARGFTQGQLAEAAGTTLRAIFYYETEAGSPPAADVEEIFQMVSELPERDQKAVIRLINSLVAVGSVRKNHTSGERNGR